jgi:hypothetical protein
MLGAPTAAFACGGSSPSAVNVYVECLQGGGSKATHHKSSGGTSPTTPVTSVPSNTARVLAHAGHDKALLTNLVSGQGQGLAPSDLQSSGPATTPSAIGSAFDLGSGPTVLLLILAGTAVVLLGGSGLRFWQRRNHQV